MSESSHRVETTSRLAQWRIEDLASWTHRKSDPFTMGNWNWRLSVEKNRALFIRLFPEISNSTKESPPLASFIIKVVSLLDRKCFIHPEVTDKQLKTNEDFVWAVELPLTGKFIIDVEFLDLKITSPTGSDPLSIWAEPSTRQQSNQTALNSLGRMLFQSIHTDIIINASNGQMRAHRAVLASRSPVFQTMFSHDLTEKEQSTVNISDMSLESCQAFLNYIYGNVQSEAFLTHRLALLRAADKYDVSDLKEACHESLIQDIDSENVLERLQWANLYGLMKLKDSCLRYLVRFGKIYDVRDELDAFVRRGDRDLVGEVFNRVLDAWKGL